MGIIDRSVSLTSQVSKVMEILIRDAIIDHLYSKKLIRDTQHGFTQGRSCLTNLLKFLEEVTTYVDEGSPVDVLYLACSPELGTTEGYPFKIDFNLLSSCCVGMLCFMCVLKCMYSYKNNFLRNKK